MIDPKDPFGPPIDGGTAPPRPRPRPRRRRTTRCWWCAPSSPRNWRTPPAADASLARMPALAPTEIPPPSEESLGGHPRRSYGRFNVQDGQLDFGFGRITPNVKGVGWLLFDGKTQLWQGLTLGAVPTGRYTHVEPCLAALRRLHAVEVQLDQELGPRPG